MAAKRFRFVYELSERRTEPVHSTPARTDIRPSRCSRCARRVYVETSSSIIRRCPFDGSENVTRAYLFPNWIVAGDFVYWFSFRSKNAFRRWTVFGRNVCCTSKIKMARTWTFEDIHTSVNRHEFYFYRYVRDRHGFRKRGRHYPTFRPSLCVPYRIRRRIHYFLDIPETCFRHFATGRNGRPVIITLITYTRERCRIRRLSVDFSVYIYRRMFSVGVKYENSRSGIDKNDVIFKNDNSTLEIMYDVNDWTCPPPPCARRRRTFSTTFKY